MTYEQPKGRFTRYDFVACSPLTTRSRHLLCHDCRQVLKHVLKSYNFFRVVSVSSPHVRESGIQQFFAVGIRNPEDCPESGIHYGLESGIHKNLDFSYASLLFHSATGIWQRIIMHVLTMKKIWAACKRHEVMVKLVKYSLYILDFPWRNLESRTLESGIQKVGIRNPRGWNPESGIQRLGNGIQDLHGFSYMGRVS